MENRRIKKKLFDNSDWECYPKVDRSHNIIRTLDNLLSFPVATELAFTLFVVFPIKQSHDNHTKLG